MLCTEQLCAVELSTYGIILVFKKLQISIFKLGMLNLQLWQQETEAAIFFFFFQV
jgi:hypothetical protein